MSPACSKNRTFDLNTGPNFETARSSQGKILMGYLRIGYLHVPKLLAGVKLKMFYEYSDGQSAWHNDLIQYYANNKQCQLCQKSAAIDSQYGKPSRPFKESKSDFHCPHK